jgi:hypothetical protein
MSRLYKVAAASVLFYLSVALVPVSCNRDEPKVEQPNDEAEMLKHCGFKPADRLPPAFYGEWKFLESSGGISGRGDSGYSIDRIVITEGNVIEAYRSGKRISATPFKPGLGKSIFSTEDVWLLSRGQGAFLQAVEIRNGILTISDNVYDGFSYSYAKVADAKSDQKK